MSYPIFLIVFCQDFLSSSPSDNETKLYKGETNYVQSVTYFLSLDDCKKGALRLVS